MLCFAVSSYCMSVVFSAILLCFLYLDMLHNYHFLSCYSLLCSLFD